MSSLDAVGHLANTLKLIVVKIIRQERVRDLAGELVTIRSVVKNKTRL
jgi:hypothetical protein